MSVQLMSFGLPEGGSVLMYWPDCIAPDSVDGLLECVTLQCKSMKRSAILKQEKSAAPEAPNAALTGAADSTTGNGVA